MPDKLFGTDGVRGVANTELTPLLAMRLGAAAARALGRGHTPRFVVGRDTRISGTLLESALAAGLCSMGAQVVTAGVVPTPAVAGIARIQNFDAGVVISASHNPFGDNGIKFFGGDGYKLDDALEAEIESYVAEVDSWPKPSGGGVGRLTHDPHLCDLYAGHLEDTMDGVSLQNVKIVLDGANGANSVLGPRVVTDLGAEVVTISCAPDGLNINAGCGSLHPQEMQRQTVEKGADIGLAFDGDADRVMLSDEKGKLVDGDRVMCLIGRHLAASGNLTHGTVVGTIMSNMGLEAALKQADLKLLRTAVGDRYVSEAMRSGGYVLGGEKSGHLIFGRLTTTGDGLLTALQVLKVMRETGKPLSALADQMTEYPQVLLGVKVRDRQTWATHPAILKAIADAEHRLKDRGRINVRASGTEKLVRVMAEGPDQAEIDTLARDLIALIAEEVGA